MYLSFMLHCSCTLYMRVSVQMDCMITRMWSVGIQYHHMTCTCTCMCTYGCTCASKYVAHCMGSRGSLMVRAPAAKAGGPGFDPRQLLPCFVFLFQLAYTNADGVKNLWCSSKVWLLSTQTWVNVKAPSNFWSLLPPSGLNAVIFEVWTFTND